MAENEESIVAKIAKEVTQALRPLASDDGTSASGELPEFFYILLEGVGIEFEETIGADNVTVIKEALADISFAVESVLPILERAEPPALSETQSLIDAVKGAVDALYRLNSLELQAVESQDVLVSLKDLGTLLLEYLIATYLLDYHPRIFDLLLFAGIVRLGELDAPSLERRLTRVKFALIGDLVRDPKGYPKLVYGWGTPDFRAYDLLSPLLFLLQTFELPAILSDPAAEDAEALGWDPAGSPDVQLRLPLIREATAGLQAGFAALPMRTITGESTGLAIVPYGIGSTSEKRDAGNNWELDFHFGGTVTGRYGILIGYQKMEVKSLEGTTFPVDYNLQVKAGLRRKSAPETYIVLFGEGDSTVVEVGKVGVELGAALENPDLDLSFELAVEDGRVRVEKGKGDSFLQKILPEKGITSPFAIIVGFSTTRGLYFRGSAGLAVTLAIHKDILGVLKIETIDLAILAKGDEQDEAEIEVLAAVSASLKLGPFNAIVERIGLRGNLTFPESGGNLGVANLALAFKPPDGAGMSLKAKVITGGGYLFLDPKNGQYAGLLHLTVQDMISLTIIGLLTTRMPDNSNGFSLLLIITAEFPPIQLGFGFVLTGVGGLIGIHRIMAVDALRAGVRTGGLNAILFPNNPVENAVKIISDLKSFFPPADGRFIFGPMAQLAWGGVYPVLTLELGILIELPSPIRLALLGRITLALPKKEEPEDPVIVYIQMDILGVLDFEKGDLSIDATLYDSRIATFPISGDMALRFSWGANPDFAVSVGGFHPAYSPPPKFPQLNRLAIDLSTDDNIRLRAEAYMAVTTGAAMIGARLDAYAARKIDPFGTFSVEAILSFDVLVRFQPLNFVVDLSGDAALRLNGKILFAVAVGLTLSGPMPMELKGCARFEFLGMHEIPIYAIFGHLLPAETPPPLLRPVDYLFAEIEKTTNWSAQLPPEGQSVVTLREVEREENVVLAHPLGRLTIRQQIVPLKTEISRFGEAQVAGPATFDLAINFGTDTTNQATNAVRASFALPMFSEQSGDAILSQAAFVSLPSGYEAIGMDVDKVDKADFGQVLSRSFDYEETIIDNLEQRLRIKKEDRPRYSISSTVLDAAARLGGATVPALQETGAGAFAGPADQRVSLAEPVFVVASVDTLARRTGGQEASHYEAALERKEQGSSANQWQVVPRVETN